MKLQLKKILLDMVPVILGIMIALLIGKIKENADDRDFVENILVSVTKELEENKTDLEQSLTEHRQALDTVRYYLYDPNVSIGHIIGKVNGLRMVSVRNTSWKSFLNARMELIGYETISLLAGIDESRENMRIHEGKLVDFIYGNLESTGTDRKRILLLMLNDLVNLEEGMLELHNEFLDLRKTENR
ncbi:MAG: hypothetical protein ACOYXB_08305 [Bacteroidota bacterium]